MRYLVKIGGSLTPRYVPAIYEVLREITKKGLCEIIIFPGGGKFADLIREYRAKLSLDDETTHRMALASLDQNAYLISDICKCEYITSLDKLKRVKKYPVVVAPYRALIGYWPFAGYNLNIDVFSSDSSAIYIAKILRAGLIIATDVDGIYMHDPGKKKRQIVVKIITAQELGTISRGGPLDETIAGLIDRYGIKTWVVNGTRPERILQVVKGVQEIIGTLVVPTSKDH